MTSIVETSSVAFDDDFIGRTIAGKWRVEKKLGAGGMGTVYLATDLSVDRPVALKFLLPVLAGQSEYRARFEQEARVMAKVDHPNLVTLYGVERDGEIPFLVMKHVTGRTLANVIEERTKLSLNEAMPLIKQMTAALVALHVHGYVHRDLKPGNVIVSEEGHVTLLDFGLIRSHDNALTQPGVALGSPFYMSPEQALAEAVDARSDLYTLAVVLTELLSGKRPFHESDAHAALLAHLEKAPTSPHELDPSIPEGVSTVLLRALEKKPINRQQSVAQFMAEFSEAAAVSATVVVQDPFSSPVETRLARRLQVKSDDDEAATALPRERARRSFEVPVSKGGTELNAPVLPAPVPSPGVSKRELSEKPVDAIPTGGEASATTIVGLESVFASQQTVLVAWSAVAPPPTVVVSKTIDTASTTQPDTRRAPRRPTVSVSVENVARAQAPQRRSFINADTPAWVLLAIGAGSALAVTLLLWILLS
jgi:serine/threonine protein kinase